jgi:hypothetical protein
MKIERHETGPRMSKAVIHGDTVYLAGIVADSPRMAEILEPFAFDAVYGAFSGRGQIDSNGKQAGIAIFPHRGDSKDGSEGP